MNASATQIAPNIAPTPHPAPRNRIEAKRWWLQQRATWVSWTKDFLKKIQAIEDKALRYAVGGMIDSVASGAGSMAICQHPGNRLAFVGFHLDTDVHEALCRGIVAWAEHQVTLADDEYLDVDTDGVLHAADRWIKDNLMATNVIQVGFTFGRLRDITEPGGQRLLKQFVSDHIIYDLTRGKIVGVRMTDGSVYRPPEFNVL